MHPKPVRMQVFVQQQIRHKNNNDKIKREFKLTTVSLKNKSTIILVTIALAVFGILSYQMMPKELFPEVVFPRIFVNTIYPGNSPFDIENLVTIPLEKEIKSIKGIKNIESNSSQDNSNILIEFSTNVDFQERCSGQS